MTQKYLIILGAALTTMSSTTRIDAASADFNAETQRAAVVAYYKGHNEPFVEDAAWSSTTMFNVGVHYMGNQEDGFASDVCKVLQEYGVEKRARVRVIDINTMGMDQKRWEVVGEARCQ